MGKRLYVGNLSWGIDSARLEELFQEFGGVRSTEVMMDRVTGRSRGFAFVEMEDDAGTTAAMQGLNGKEVDGRPLVVNEARERTPRPAGGGRDRGYRGDSGRYADRSYRDE
jgi:cold-inducible RNA-binding protein